MQYDPIKRSLGRVFNLHPYLRAFFYSLLDLLLLRSWHIRHELRKWQKEAAENAKILDAGSGFGQYDWRLARMGNHFNITGIDVKQEQVEDCNNYFKRMNMNSRVQFRREQLETFNETERYDLVLSVDVMEHIEEDEKVMRNLYLSLKKGGTLLISTPSDQGGSDIHHHDHHEGATGFIDEHVRDGYNINDIREKLLKAGFSKVDTRYSYGKSGNIAWKLSMKYPILALNTTKLFFIFLPVYYAITYPFAYILNHIDIRSNHKTGTGLIVKAIK